MPPRRGFPWPLLRVALLAGFSIVACVWALRRAYQPRPAMIVPFDPAPSPSAPSSAPSSASGELPAPDLEPSPSSAPPSTAPPVNASSTAAPR
ncbi:MAG: hypothetical protein IPG50_34600 [Myxococcales bacterium]|nr:hypothetical protein [Myxococcales bacterium]